METKDKYAKKLLNAKKRWRRARHSISAGLFGLTILGGVYLTRVQPPQAPTEIRNLHEAEQTLYWLEHVNEQGGRMPQNSHIEGIVTKFTNGSEYKMVKKNIETEITRLETLPIVQEYVQGCEDFEDQFGKRMLIMFSSLFGALGLSMIPYFREQKKYYDTYRGVIDEQRKDINQSLEKICQHIDDKVEIIKERREKDSDL